MTNARGIIMKTLLVLLLSCLVAVPAFSVIDPDPDMLGIYFDQNADDNCLMVGTDPFFAYLILTNPTVAAINAYEFSFENCICTGTDQFFFMTASNIAHGAVEGLDVGVHDKLGGDYIVGLAEPLVTSPATILHSWQYLSTAIQPIRMFLGPSSVPSIPGGLPVIQDAETSTLMTVGLSTGGPEIPVATVNFDDCVVSVEHRAWGEVKALFR
jgi:hypothetical protein